MLASARVQFWALLLGTAAFAEDQSTLLQLATGDGTGIQMPQGNREEVAILEATPKSNLTKYMNSKSQYCTWQVGFCHQTLNIGIKKTTFVGCVRACDHNHLCEGISWWQERKSCTLNLQPSNSKSCLECVRTTSTTTATATTQPGMIVINEIMKNPSNVSDANGEWFEVFNAGGAPVDMNNWTIRDDGSDMHVISCTLVVQPGAYAVLARNADFATNGNVKVDYEYSGFLLSNADDEVILEDIGGTEVDRVEYDDDFPDEAGKSMELCSPQVDNNVGANWGSSTSDYNSDDTGTPGAANSFMTCPP